MATLDDQKADVSKIETRALSTCAWALAFAIQNDADAVAADHYLNDVINPLIREGDELFDPMISAAYRAHQVAIATKKKAVGGLPAAKQHLRNELGRWALIVEDRERTERLRIEREAAEAEALRIEREIVAVEAAGEPDAVEQIQAILDSPRPAFTLPPAALGPSMVVPGARDIYRAEAVNLREFYRAIGDGRIPVSLAEPRQSALDAMARTMREGFNIPGWKMIKTKGVNSRSAR
jgi:hypothetical protein